MARKKASGDRNKKKRTTRKSDQLGNRGWFNRFLAFVEWLGNILPHPVMLFALCVALVVVSSAFAEWFGLSVVDPRPEGAKGRSATGMIEAVSLLSGNGLRWMVTNIVPNFSGFAPLGTVLVAMLGVGVAESSGLLSTGIRAIVLKAPHTIVSAALVLAGVLSNMAAEMGYVVLVPLGGFIFLTLGRHPLAGMAAAFAGVSGGYSANLLLGTLDPLLAGITQEAAQLLAPGYSVHAAVNWYFMMISTFFITGTGTFVTEKIVEPNLGKFTEGYGDTTGIHSDDHLKPITPEEKRALLLAGLTAFGLTLVFAATIVPSWGILRNPETGAVLRSPFLKGIISLVLVFFFVPSVVFGYTTKRFKSTKDVVDGMASAMRSLAMYIVLVFFAAQFIAFFKWTNLGPIVAVLGANFLKSIGFTGPVIFFPFIMVCGFVNLMVGSASAQWAMTAPIFVPMLMLLGYSPEVIQAAYRIGDSTTNIITPMMIYFGLVLAFAHRFDKRIGVGTIISTMLPYSIFFIVGWSILFYVWVFVFNLPVGPATPTYYTP